MRNPKISLKLWIAARIVPPVMALVWYHFAIQPNDSTVFNFIRFVLTVIVIGALIFLGKKRDMIDESAKAIMKKTDQICLGLFYFLSVLILVSCMLFIDNAKIIGYFVAGELVIVTAVKIILFWIYDSRGMK